VVEIKNGKRVTVTRRLYPGYVLVKMLANQRTMHVINNIQGVIKFVGAGADPQPLRDDEVNKILGLAPVEEEAEPKEEIPFRAGQVVEVTEALHRLHGHGGRSTTTKARSRWRSACSGGPLRSSSITRSSRGTEAPWRRRLLDS
jgi:hypothetical protein